MKKLIFISFLVTGLALHLMAGTLTGRIIDNQGNPLRNAAVLIQWTNDNDAAVAGSIEIHTNGYGGYSAEIPDGSHTLIFTINEIRYQTIEPITVYSPRTKQNWRYETIGEDNNLIGIN